MCSWTDSRQWSSSSCSRADHLARYQQVGVLKHANASSFLEILVFSLPMKPKKKANCLAYKGEKYVTILTQKLNLKMWLRLQMWARAFFSCYSTISLFLLFRNVLCAIALQYPSPLLKYDSWRVQKRRQRLSLLSGGQNSFNSLLS